MQPDSPAPDLRAKHLTMHLHASLKKMQPDSPAPDLRAKHLTMHLSESWDSEDRRSMLKLKLDAKVMPPHNYVIMRGGR